MTKPNNGNSCQITCWALAALVGFLTMVLLVVLVDYSWTGAIFLAGVAFAVVGLVFSLLFCNTLPKPGEVAAHRAGSAPTVPAGKSATSAGTSAARPDAGVTARKAQAAAGDAVTSGKEAASLAAESAKAAAADAVQSVRDAAGDAADKAKDAAVRAKDATANLAKNTTDKAAEAKGVKPTSALAGEEDLASRKGDWKYDKDADGSAGDVTVEGVAPATLDRPRDGGADDLKRIKGIGPKLEKLCNSKGFYHFDQIANWTPAEVAWVNENLVGFKGRVSRDNWVQQAHLLATGTETEFSKRVDDGDVY